ncbi:MAG: type ISP restriction/modification enzyme [Deltaproteobacteria bacterium]|nr:type ISP restriction/modification enzyme [Deltaproteobacteria bacterium]
MFRLCSQSQWNYADAKKELARGQLRNQLTPILYRPFDVRWTVFNRHVAVHRRERVMRHMIRGHNIALIATRQTRDEWHILTTDCLMGHKAMAAFDINSVFPLYLCPPGDALDASAGRRPNINPKFLQALAEELKAPQEGPHGLLKGVTPEDIFHYAYAVFHSPTYRTRYGAFLKIDFPHLPLTSNRDLFFSLAALGGELGALHLMESPKLNDLITEFPEKGTDAVEKVQYTEKDKRVWINPVQYFGGVPAAAWNFHIGGYQVCEKWLKDRKGRKLTYQDTQHYQRIVVAMNETIRLMGEIDKVIEAQGGWPDAFSGSKT